MRQNELSGFVDGIASSRKRLRDRKNMADACPCPVADMLQSFSRTFNTAKSADRVSYVAYLTVTAVRDDPSRFKRERSFRNEISNEKTYYRIFYSKSKRKRFVHRSCAIDRLRFRDKLHVSRHLSRFRSVSRLFNESTPTMFLILEYRA